MALCPGGGTDLFDIGRSPLADFHYQENYKQGKLAKVRGQLEELDWQTASVWIFD